MFGLLRKKKKKDGRTPQEKASSLVVKYRTLSGIEIPVVNPAPVEEEEDDNGARPADAGSEGRQRASVGSAGPAV